MSGRGIDKAICAVKALLAAKGGITKENRAPMGYSFRGIEDFDNILCGITAEFGIVAYPRILSKDIRHGTSDRGKYQSHVVIEVEWTYVCTEDGSNQVASTVGEAMDSSDKAFNKAMQAARKYADIMVFRIPTSGDDTEAEAHQPAPLAKTQGTRAAPPAAKDSPPVPAQGPVTGNSPIDDAMKRVTETNTLAVLTAFADEVSNYVEPGRSELLKAIEGRACMLFADTKTIEDVQAGYALSASMGGAVKSACNKAYARVRRNSHGTGASS